MSPPMPSEPSYSSQEIVAQASRMALEREAIRASRERIRLDPAAPANPDARREASRILSDLGIEHSHAVTVDAGPDALLDDLLEVARLAREHPTVRAYARGRPPPWLADDLEQRPIDDRGLGELLFQALSHAVETQDQELRSAIDARRSYRQILDGAEASPGDDSRYGLRYDLTHAPRPGTSRITIILTRNCQLRCTYCMVKLWNEDSTPELVERVVDRLFSGEGDSVRLQFYGGEPLLKPDLFRLGVNRARRLEADTGKRCAMVVITNGLTMTPELAEYAAAQDVEVIVSLDGAMDTTNQWRVPNPKRGKTASLEIFDSYGGARRALELLMKAGCRNHVIMTTTPETAGSVAESFEHLRSLGAKMIQVDYAMGRHWGEQSTEVLAGQFERILDEHGKDIQRGDLLWVNLYRVEPLLVDTALQVETSGNICFMNECLFEKEKRAPNYPIADIRDDVQMQRLGSTRFHNLYVLCRSYGDRDPRYRETILDNIRVGTALRSRLQSLVPDLPVGGET